MIELSNIEDKYFDLRCLSDYSSLSIPCLRDHIKEDLLPAYKVKGKILIKRSEFDAWIKGFKVKDMNQVADEILEGLK